MTKRRPPLRAGRGLFAPVIVLIGAATLFALSWQSHRSAELRSEYSRLLRERQYEVDRLVQLQSLWQRETSRREIVPRAIEELQMVEYSMEAKVIIALESGLPRDSADPGFGERLLAGFDRYGRVGAAFADEAPQEPQQ